MFSRKAVFEFQKTENMDLEELELNLIDAALDTMEEEDGTVLVYGDYSSFGTLSAKFDELEIALTKATLERIANNPVEFSETEQIDIDKLIDKIEEDDDVQAVYTNIG